jgi:RNA polymerase sigma factor (sigma-70 family)
MLMKMTSNLELLGQFAREKSQDAFTALVNRHVNLVYSAALRQVRSPQLAEEVAQSVFADLARNAAKLSDATGGTPVLTAWLYSVTRRTAIDVIRKESRRQLREQIAVEMNDMNATANEWTQIEPLLDDAMVALDETDRSAILLRYFENKTLREVGEALGASDDAAQKRVGRAVERLREFFSKRNVTIGAGGLAVLISANAVQAAPISLTATISAAVFTGTAVATSTAISTTKIIAMTTLQKTFVAAALTAAIGTGIFEAQQNSKLREQNQNFQQQQNLLSDQLAQLQREHDAATNQIVGLLTENAQLKSNPNQNELLKLRGEVSQLRRQAAEREPRPVASASTTPASALAPTTEAEFEMANRQMSFAMERVQTALRQFVTNNPYGVLIDTNGQPNPDLFANFPGLPLDNLEIKARDVQGMANALDQKSRLILAETKEPIFYNGMWTRFYLLADGTVRSDINYTSSQQFQIVYPSDEDLEAMRANTESLPENLKNIMTTMAPVLNAFSAANNGNMPTDPAQLAPYVTTPEQQAALQQVLEMKQKAHSNN